MSRIEEFEDLPPLLEGGRESKHGRRGQGRDD